MVLILTLGARITDMTDAKLDPIEGFMKAARALRAMDRGQPLGQIGDDVGISAAG